MSAEMSYSELQKKLDASIYKDEMRQKVLRAKRAERQSIKKAGGGHAIAKALMPNDTDFTYGHNQPAETIDQRIERETAERGCMGRVACQVCKKFHGYCVEIDEDKERNKMLPTGDNQPSSKSNRKGGLAWLKIEDLNTTPQEAKILMVKFNEDGAYGPRVNLKMAFKGEIRYLGLKPTKKDPRYKALIEKFGADENNWVNERILLFAEKDDFSEGYNMHLTIPEATKSRR